MIKGFDVSKWQGADFIRNKIKDQKYQFSFVVIKASEGRTYTDPVCTYHAGYAELCDIPVVGFYHYARPELGNTPQDEATNFLMSVEKAIKELSIEPFLALDWEGEALKCNPDWAYAFCKHVRDITGKPPMVYVSQSNISKVEKLLDIDCGLWVAKWSDKAPNNIGKWPFWAMWQYTSSPFDKDQFNGSVDTLKKYCTDRAWLSKEDEPEADVGKCHCGCKYCCE